IARGAAADRARDVSPDPGAVNPGLFSEAFAFDGETRVTIYTGRAGFRSTESAGVEWRRAMDGYLDDRAVEPYANGFCQAPSNPSVLYSPSGQVDQAGNFVPMIVFRSADLGRSWQAKAAVGLTPFDCAVDSRDPDLVYVLAFDQFTGEEAFFRSTDRAQSWTSFPSI